MIQAGLNNALELFQNWQYFWNIRFGIFPHFHFVLYYFCYEWLSIKLLLLRILCHFLSTPPRKKNTRTHVIMCDVCVVFFCRLLTILVIFSFIHSPKYKATYIILIQVDIKQEEYKNRIHNKGNQIFRLAMSLNFYAHCNLDRFLT